MAGSGQVIEAKTSGGDARSLLERGVALELVTDALGKVQRGSGAVVFLRGAAGIGKTAVIEAGRAQARTAGFTVAAAVGTPTEARLPFGLFGQALVALGGSAVEDVVELARLGGRPARLYRTLRFLAAVASGSPLMLALDDLHWADADSVELLGFVCRRLSGTRILVLGSLRPEPEAASLLADELEGSGHAQLIELERLSRAASAALLAASVCLDPAERERVLDACAGSPLLLKVAASTLTAGGSVPRRSDRGGFARSLLLERFVGLGHEAFRYVQAGSVFGVRFKPALAGALAGIDDLACEQAHRRLVHAGLLEDLGGAWAAFVHPLFAQALFDGITRSERERAHERAFRLLVARGEPDAVAAEHAAAARLLHDPLAVEVTTRAGREALAQGALEAARTHFADAVELAGAGAGPQLLADYAMALSALGRARESQGLCRQLLARAELAESDRAQALALMARSAVVAGEPVDAERLYAQAAAAVSGERHSKLTVLADAAFTCHISSPIPWVLSVTRQALELAPPGSATSRSLRILEAYSTLMGGDPSTLELLTRDCREWLYTNRAGDHSWAWTLAVYALNAFKLFEDFGGATEVFEREFPLALEEGAPIMINALAIAYADFVHRLGRCREALELVRSAEEVSGMHMSPWHEVAVSVLLTELGRDEEAEPHLAVLRLVTAGTPPEYYAPVSLWLAVIEARHLLAAGEPEAASAKMLDAAEVARRSGWRHPSIVPWAQLAVEAHLAASHPERVRVLLDQLEPLSAPLGARWPAVAIAVGHAGLEASAGRLGEADRQFLAALGICDELPYPIAHAETLLSYGRHLRRTGRPREARAPLGRALELAERAGSGRLARQARAELGASGGRRRRGAEGRAALTAQEQRVAALAASGMTNARIAAALTVSSKTVDNHLQRIYSKLGIHSRRELMQIELRPVGSHQAR